MLAPAEAQTINPVLEITDANYVALPTGVGVFGEGQVVYVKLTDPQGRVVQSQGRTAGPAPDFVTSVTAKSTKGSGSTLAAVDPPALTGTGSTPWSFNLLETGPTTGIYTGSFTVSTSVAACSVFPTTCPGRPTVSHSLYGTSANPGLIFGDGRLRVDATAVNTITVSLPAVTGITTTPSDTVTWQRATNAAGNIVIQETPALITDPVTSVQNVINGYTSRLIFSITDADLNTNTTHAQTYPILLFSDSDRVGELVPLVESVPGNPPTATNDGSLFVASIGFENVSVPSNGKLFVREGDRVFARWVEPRDAQGSERVFELPRDVKPYTFWTFSSSSDSVVEFGLPAYLGIDPAPNDAITQFFSKVTVRVFDPDRGFGSSQLDTVSVAVKSTTDSTGFNVELREVRGLSGEFVGDFFLNTTSGVLPTQHLRVAHGDTITATYIDPKDFEGVTRTRTKEVRFFVADRAQAVLGRVDNNFRPLDTRLVGTNTDHNVQVFDFDANLDATRKESIVVRVKSTSDPTSLLLVLQEDGDNTGRFVGSFRFTEGAAGPGLLRVADRDQVVAEYNDLASANGLSDRVLSNVITWRKPTDPTIFIGADSATSSTNHYFRKVDHFAFSTTATSQGDDYGTRATIIVQDQDQNDPLREDSITVNLVDTRLGRAVAVTAHELGPDSGLFVVEAPFGREPTVDGILNQRFEPVPTIVVTPSTGLSVRETDNPLTAGVDDTRGQFQVFLTKPPIVPVILPLASATTDILTVPALAVPVIDPLCPPPVLVNPTQLCFGPTNYHARQTVTFVAVDTAIAEGDVTGVISLGPDTTTLEAAYRGLNPRDVIVTRVDDEIQTPTDLIISETNDYGPDGGLFLIERTIPAGGAAPYGARLTFSVQLTHQPTASVTLTITSKDPSEVRVVQPGNGTGSQAVAQTSRGITFGTGSGSCSTATNFNCPQTVTLETVQDDLWDGDVPVAITLSTDSTDPRYRADRPPNERVRRTLMVTNYDDEHARVIVGVPRDGARVTTGETVTTSVGFTTFPIAVTKIPTTSNGQESAVTVNIRSTDTSEGRVSTPSVVLGGAGGVLGTTVTVTGIDDSILDGDVAYLIETDPVVIPSGGDAAYAGFNPDDVLVVNVDNDGLTDRILVTPVSGLRTIESSPPTTTSFTIALATQPSASVSIGLVSQDTTEGTVSPSSVTFTPANFNQPQTITVTSVDDNVADGPVAYTIRTLPATSIDPIYNGMDASDVVVVNEDRAGAAPRLVITQLTGPASESTTAATFEVCLNPVPAASVTIPLSSSDPSELLVTPASLVINSGACAPGVNIITARGVDDRLNDGDIQAAIVTGVISSADPVYAGFNPSDIAVVNVDDDRQRVVVTPLTGVLHEYGEPTQTFSVVLNAPPTDTVTIPVRTGTGSEVALGATSITFTPANYLVPRTVTVRAIDDAVMDGMATPRLGIQLEAITSNDPYYRGFDPSDVLATTVDNDRHQAMAYVSAPTPNMDTDEANLADTATVQVVLNRRPTANVFVPLSITDPTEGEIRAPAADVPCPTIVSRCLVFTPANYFLAQSVVVGSTGDDAINDGPMEYALRLHPVVSTDLSFHGLDPSDVMLRNLDADATTETDVIEISLVTGSANLVEGGDAAIFRVNFAPTGAPPGGPVTISLTSSDPSEATVSPASLTLTPADNALFPAPATFTVTPVQDSIDDDRVDFVIITEITTGTASYPASRGIRDIHMSTSDEATGRESLTPTRLEIVTDTLQTFEGGPTVNAATFALSKPPTATTNVVVSLTDPTEAVLASPSTVAFTATYGAGTSWHVPQAIIVDDVEDEIIDGTSNFALIFTGSASFDVALPFANLDNDGSPVIASASSLTTTEGGASASFTVRLKVPPSNLVNVQLSSSNFREAEVSPRLVSFDASNWNVPQRITVSGIDDALPDGDVTYGVIIGPLVSADPFYSGRTVSAIGGRNIDNDNTVPFRAEYVDPVAGDGASRPFLSQPARWTQGSAARFLVFEDPTTGQRINKLALDSSGRTRQDAFVNIAAYGDFGGSWAAHAESNLCRNVHVNSASSTDGDDMEYTMARQADNPFRYLAVVNLTKDRVPSTAAFLACNGIVGDAIPVEDTDRFEVVAGANSGRPQTSFFTGVGKDSLAVRVMPQPTFSLLDPRTGTALTPNQLHGRAAAVLVRVSNNLWNQDSNARELATLDVYQDLPGAFATVGYPPHRIRVVETGPDTGEFVGSFGLAPAQTIDRGYVGRSDADLGLTFRALEGAALCVVDSNAVWTTTTTALGGRSYAEGLFLISRPSCTRVEHGDLNLTSGRTSTPRQVQPGWAARVDLLPMPAAANYRRIGANDIYLDANGDGVVSPNDMRLNDGAFVNTKLPSASQPQQGICNDGLQPTGGTGGGNYPCGQAGTFLGTVLQVERFVDITGDGRWDSHEPIYLDLDGSGTVSVGDYRLNRVAGLLHNRVPIQAPANVALARVFVENGLPQTPPTTPLSVTRGALYAALTSDPSFQSTPGYGLVAAPIVEILDDDYAGAIFGEKHIGADRTTYRAQAGSIHPNWAAVYVNRLETDQKRADTPTGGSSPQFAVGSGAAERISDRNGDGVVGGVGAQACADVVVVGATCTEVIPETGVIKVQCPSNAASCTISQVRYQYRAALAASPSSVFQFRVAEFRDVVFGAAIPGDHDIFLNYRPQTIKVPVRSDRTGESELVTFSLPNDASRSTYRAAIPVETTGAAGNGLVHVSTLGGAGDRLRVIYNDARMVDGKPGNALEQHFRSRIGYGEWHPAQDAVISFHDPSFATTDTQVTAGAFVQIQVVDVDADTTDQADTIVVTARNGANAADQVLVTLRESGAHTGVFQGAVPVNDPATPATQRLDIASTPGSIIVIYQDPQLASGVSAPLSASINWRPTTTGVVSVAPAVGPATTATCPGGLTVCTIVKGSQNALIVTVNDQDANRDDRLRETVTVNVRSVSDPVGETITLTETTATSGVFTSTGVRFETAQAIPNNGLVFARDANGDGEALRVTYEDLRNQNGVRQVVEPLHTGNPLAIFWDRTFDGVVSWDRQLYVGVDADTTGFIRPATVYVADGDLNVNTRMPDHVILPATQLTATAGRVESDGRISGAQVGASNPKPVTLNLFETGANTGVFMATFDFTAGGNSEADVDGAPGAIAKASIASIVESGRIRAEYSDPIDSRGLTQLFSREVEWSRAGVGKIFFRDAGYNARTLRPNITLIDKDLDVPGTSGAIINTVNINVRSTANPSGVTVILRETSTTSGIFHAEFELTSSTSSNAVGTTLARLRVNDIDDIVAVYNDVSPAASRTASAHIGIGEITPPITSLVTAPATADGLNRPGQPRFFITDPLVSFTANKPIDTTFFQVGTLGSPQVYEDVPFRLAERFGEGLHTIKFWSIDVFGNEEEDPSVQIGVDLTPPNQAITGLTGVPSTGGSVRLNWTAVPITANPLEFFDYVIYRDGSATILANSTSPSFTDTTLTDETAHIYRVAVRDQSGRVGPLSAPVSVIPDRTAPVVTNGIANPGTFDFRAKPTTIAVTVSAVDANMDRVRASLTAPNGTVLSAATLTARGGAVFGGNLGTANITGPCSCKVNFTATDKAGNVGRHELALTVSGPDADAPEINFQLGAEAQIVVGQPLTIEVTDNVGLGAIRYRLNNLADVTVPVSPANSATMTFQVNLDALPLGPHTITVFAEDIARDANGTLTPNRANRTGTFSIVVEIGTVVPPPTTGAGNFFLVTRATVQADGSILVEWDVPADVAGTVVGFQVWRASSPFVLIANVTSPNQRSHLDTQTLAGAAYRYVATYSTAASGLFTRLAQVPGYPGSDDQVEGSGIARRGDDAVPGWLWVLLGVLGVLAVAVILAVVLAGRRGGGQQVVVRPPPPPEEPAPAQEAVDAPTDAPQERHRLRCPACEHRFEVSGTKPIVTTCPNCGRKGILR